MAKKKETPVESQMTLKESALLLRAKKNVEKDFEAEDHNFTAGKEDLQFCNNEGHWHPQILSERNQAGRPSLMFNLLVPFIRDVQGEQRQSRPHTKVKPVDAQATKSNAEIKEGYLRNRKYKCKADNAYDTAFGQQLRGGFGCYRILTEYENDDGFDQTFIIESVPNQFTVLFDRNAKQWHKNDGEHLTILSYFDKTSFEKKWPGVTPSSFSSSSKVWYPSKDKFTVAEYYEKEHFEEAIYQLSDGNVVKKEDIPEGVEKKVGSLFPDGRSIVKKRKADKYKIYRWLLCGHAALEGPTEWPCKYWGVIPVDGDEIVVDGKTHKRSLIRFSKDSLRAYNMSRCTELEALSMVPKSPIQGTAAMFEGYEEQWDNAVKATYSRLIYNPDPMMPGMKPERLFGLDPSYVGAIAQSSMQAKEEIRQTIGPNILLPRSSSGGIPDISSTALGKWQAAGDVSTYVFVDNLQRAIEWGDLVCVELMKRIMDTERIITIRKMDGASQEVPINKKVINPQSGQEVTINNMTVGEYGVETTLGPSYSAQRAALADAMLRFVQTIPNIAAGTADILAGMLFDVSQSGQEAGGSTGGSLEAFVKRVKKLNIKSGAIDITDLKPEELREFLPVLMKPRPIPPPLLAKMKVDIAKAAKLMADAEKSMAQTGTIRADMEKEIFNMLAMLGMIALSPQQQQPPPVQAQLPGQMPGGGMTPSTPGI